MNAYILEMLNMLIMNVILNKENMKIKLEKYLNIIITNLVELFNNFIKLISNIKYIVIRIGINIQDLVVFSLKYFWNVNISNKVFLLLLFIYFHNFLISMKFITLTLFQFLFNFYMYLYNLSIFDINLDILLNIFQNINLSFSFDYNVNNLELGILNVSCDNNFIGNTYSEMNIIEDINNINTTNNSIIDNNNNNNNNDDDDK